MNFERTDHVTIDDYMMMIRLKTAVLLAGALKIGALYAGAPQSDTEHLYQFGIHLGLAFQLQDDLLDSYGDVTVFGKQTGQDIRDNKKTYLIIKALQTAPTDLRDELAALFSTTPADSDAKVARVRQIYDQIDIPAQVNEAIRQEFLQAQSHLDSVRVEQDKKAPLANLLASLSDRKK